MSAVTPSSLGSQPSAHTHSAQYVWYAILLLAAVNVFNYMDRMALAVLLPLIKADLKLSDAQLGLLIGLAFSLFYAICAIPIARWADRGIRRNIIALALTTWSLMTALSGAAQNFLHLFIARIGVGAGEAGCLPPAQSMICDYVPPQRRPGMFAINSFGLVVGMMVGMALAGALGQAVGWRWTFVILGLPGLLLAALVRLTLQEPRRGAFDEGNVDDVGVMPFGLTLATLWQCRTYRIMLGFYIVNGFVQFGLLQWWPSFYTRVHGLPLASAGLYLGIATGVGFGLGMLIGGVLANRITQRGPGFSLYFSAAVTAAAVPLALACLFAPSPRVSIVLVGLVCLCWGIPNGPGLGAIYSVTRANMRAMAGAILIFVAAVGGHSLGPFGVGWVSDLLTAAHGEQALRYALLLPTSLLLAMIVALYAAAKALPHDLKSAQ